MEVLAFLIHIWKYFAYFFQKQKNKTVEENIIKCQIVHKGGGEDGPAMWIIFNISKYYYKSVNVVKGGGVKLFKKNINSK